LEGLLKIQEAIEIVAIQEHLIATQSGVRLDVQSVPGHPGEHRGFKGTLEADDVNKLILWWEFQKHTVDQNCSLTDLLPTAAALPRVRSFLEGDPSRDLAPLDLTLPKNMELVVVTNDVFNGWLYIIDGNNRAVAQRIRNVPFQGVPVFVCEHPAMDKWTYIPEYYKKLWNLN
jgi:hypothetical protein